MLRITVRKLLLVVAIAVTLAHCVAPLVLDTGAASRKETYVVGEHRLCRTFQPDIMESCLLLIPDKPLTLLAIPDGGVAAKGDILRCQRGVKKLRSGNAEVSVGTLNCKSASGEVVFVVNSYEYD